MTVYWKEILAPDSYAEYHSAFVELMRCMDPRYRAFSVHQLKQWLNRTGDNSFPEGSTLYAFARFNRDLADPELKPSHMYVTLLARHDWSGTVNPRRLPTQLHMLGWCRTTAEDSDDDDADRAALEAEMDSAIDAIVEKGIVWFDTLDAPKPDDYLIEAFMPHSMGDENIGRLHDRIYARAMDDADETLSIRSQRRTRDALYVQLRLARA